MNEKKIEKNTQSHQDKTPCASTAWFDEYTGSTGDLREHSCVEGNPDQHVEIIDTDIGRRLNFQRLAIHHVVLAPQKRSSYPHAESLEEEFIYVLKGQPHVWINGYLYQLQAGHAIGFPAGTGVAHTFINNTDVDIELLVLGERTKKENFCYFPINPELAASSEIRWHNAPQHTLGPHNGEPGPIQKNAIGGVLPKCVVFCPNYKKNRSFHYPGDNETFGEGFRISNEVGLQALGVWFEILPPGRRSAFPHAHTHEEEFIYVLQGHPTVWLNGYVKKMEPGMYAAFPPGTGIAHVIINDTTEPVIYLGVGETFEFPDEKISYPLNPLRELECKRKGWAWTHVPKHPFGSHRSKPSNDFPEHLALIPCRLSDVEEVLNIFKTSRNYFKNVEGCEPNLEVVEHFLKDIPKEHTDKYLKENLIIEYQGKKFGVVDVHINHPEDGTCYLGLLIIDEKFTEKGLGRKCYLLIEDYIKRAHESKKNETRCFN
ncbi:MAG: cupin domain-containing protein [Oligoflexales bacterium]|nr:cupin domain-containing protein [Oligoflexales bacterium]